jgi:rare lipoprotein A
MTKPIVLTIKTLLFLLVFSTVLYAQEVIIGQTFKGKCSYYGQEFIGRKTSNGEVLRGDSFTCAHRTLPFGTMLEVENPVTKKWVVVRVNDRGPFSKNRVIDLSFAAAKQLGMMQAGIFNVTAMIVGKNGEVVFRRDPPLSEILDSNNLNEKVKVPFKNNK